MKKRKYLVEMGDANNTKYLTNRLTDENGEDRFPDAKKIIDLENKVEL